MFKCPFCNCLKSEELFLPHVKLEHKDEMHNKFQCNYNNCNKKFHNIYSYKRHYKLKHINVKLSMQSIESNPKSQKEDANITDAVDEDFNEFISSSNLNDYDSSISNILIDNSKEMSYQQFAKITIYEVACLIAKLYAKNNLNRKTSHEVIWTMINFYKEHFINNVRNKYEQVNGLSLMLSIIQESFETFKTEYLIFKYFIQKGTLILPCEISTSVNLNSRCHSVASDYKSIEIERDIQNVPIKKVLQKFLELPGVLDSIKTNVEKLKNSKTLDSLFTGELYTSVAAQHYKDELLLALMVYNDDLEINNKEYTTFPNTYCQAI